MCDLSRRFANISVFIEKTETHLSSLNNQRAPKCVRRMEEKEAQSDQRARFDYYNSQVLSIVFPAIYVVA